MNMRIVKRYFIPFFHIEHHIFQIVVIGSLLGRFRPLSIHVDGPQDESKTKDNNDYQKQAI